MNCVTYSSFLPETELSCTFAGEGGLVDEVHQEQQQHEKSEE